MAIGPTTRRSLYRGNLAEFELRFLLLVLVGLGFLGEHVGLHTAVVAFVAGPALSEVIQDHEALEPKLKAVVFSLLAPVFFLRAGTQLDRRGFETTTIVMTLVLLVVSVGLKYAGTVLTARWLAPALGGVAGVLFNYRLTFGIITATLRLQEGWLDQRLFTAMLLVGLASAMLPMILPRDLPSELD